MLKTMIVVEMKVKTIMKYHLTPVRLAPMRKMRRISLSS
jgi:hypothetical protein